jgi:hypothetical protein
MMKKILLLLLLLFLNSPAYATNWCEDADINRCHTFDIDGRDDSAKGQNLSVYSDVVHATATPPAAYSSGYYACNEAAGTGAQIYDNDGTFPTGNATIVFWAYADYTKWANATFMSYNGTTMKVYLPWTAGGNAYFDMVDTGDGRVYYAYAAYDDKWTHNCYIGTASNREMYLDGVSKVSTGKGIAISSGLTDFGLCAASTGGATTWVGYVSQYADFNTALDGTDCNSIMNDGLLGSGAAPTRNRLMTFD